MKLRKNEVLCDQCGCVINLLDNTHTTTDDGDTICEDHKEPEQETIVCDNCSYEYPRQVGDDCPSCGENNHEQYVRKYG